MKIMFFHEVYECKKVKPHHMMILVGSRKRKKKIIYKCVITMMNYNAAILNGKCLQREKGNQA